MKNHNLYHQCALSHGDTRTIGWIPERASKVGCKVELKTDGFSGLWDVNKVYGTAVTRAYLEKKEAARRDPGNFPSIAGS
ncbi:MAG: hypothetical protein ABJN26_25385 [Stappiaceae bacterium]